jgi:hypothetical protein
MFFENNKHFEFEFQTINMPFLPSPLGSPQVIWWDAVQEQEQARRTLRGRHLGVRDHSPGFSTPQVFKT